MDPKETINLFDAYLAERGLRLEATVIGAAALRLLGVIDRATRDVDIIEPELPEAVLEASRAFASTRTSQGFPIQSDWLNDGPSSLASTLPEGWRTRRREVFSGAALQLVTLGRHELLATKVFAYCDRETDADDCAAMRPTAAELEAVRGWVEYQDANPAWPGHVQARIAALLERIRDA